MFPKVIEYLEKSNTQMNTNISNQIDYKNPSNTNQINRVQNIRFIVWNCKLVVSLVLAIFTFTCLY